MQFYIVTAAGLNNIGQNLWTYEQSGHFIFEIEISFNFVILLI